MKVWVSKKAVAHKGTKFHVSPTCKNCARIADTARVDLKDIERPDPCYICFPSAPRQPKMVRRWCPECNDENPYPCRHNGGVLVRVPDRKSKRGFRTRYVWPDNAHRYEIEDDLVQS